MTDLEAKKCFICGQPNSDSVDHIPPKCLFASKYRDNNLITVPAHKTCNQAFSMDDEYFRDNLVLAATLSSKAALELFDKKVVKAFKRKEAKAYRKMFRDEISTVNIQTPSGLYLKTLPIKLIDMKRTDAVVERTCRGLYFKRHSTILPIDCPITVSMLKPEAIKIRNQLQGKSIFRTIIPEIFEYVMLSDKSEPMNSFFLLFIYSTLVFHVNTGKVAAESLKHIKDTENYDKLEGIKFTDETLWFPPGINIV